MLIKIHKSYRDIVAVCDSDLIGKKFEEDKFQLDVKESFYEGTDFDEKEAIDIMKDFQKEDATFNIVGKESTDTAIKAGIVTQDGIKRISGIPFVLVLM